MSIEIIRQRERITSIEYRKEFRYLDSPGWGFSFPCDEEGNVQPDNPTAEANYQGCLSGEVGGHKVKCIGIQRYDNCYVRPAIGKCHCGREVMLESFTNTCDCGADYNSSGQRLAHRSQWGEETGEHLSDILNIQ